MQKVTVFLKPGIDFPYELRCLVQKLADDLKLCNVDWADREYIIAKPADLIIGDAIEIGLSEKDSQSLISFINGLTQAYYTHGYAQYEKGKKDGQNILLQLARGDLSITEFNRLEKQRLK